MPRLPGPLHQGETYEEALENIRDLIRLHLERNTPPVVKIVGVATVEIEA